MSASPFEPPQRGTARPETQPIRPAADKETPSMRHDPTPAPRRPRALVLALAAVMALPCAPLPMAAAAEPARHAKERDARLTIDLENVDIAAAVQAVAAATGRNFIIDPRVKGQITLRFPHPVTPDEVYLALLTQLRLVGYAVVEANGVDKVIPEADARLQSTTVGVGESSARIPAHGDQIITQVFQLRNQNANNLVAALRPLISPNNTINVDPGSNALIITDYAENLRRLARIISGLDVPGGSEVDVVPLHNAVATELAPTLQKLLDMQGTTGTPSAAPQPGGVVAVSGSGGMRAVVLADANSNSLILRAANGAQLQQIEAMVARLDRADDASDIHVVQLRNADAVSLARTLRGVLGSARSDSGLPTQTMGGTAASATLKPVSTSSGGSGANSAGLGAAPDFSQRDTSAEVTLPRGGTVYADSALNALIINAPPPVYAQLRQVIERLDVRRAQVYVQALIAEVDASKAAQIGIQWQALAEAANQANGIYVGSNFGGGANNIVNLQGAISTKNTAAVNAALASGGSLLANGLNIGVLHNVAGNAVLGLLANFLQSQQGTNVLSAPTLMTLDNEEAKIVVGQNVPFITGSYLPQSGSNTNPFQTVDRQDVGLTLKIRPQITAGKIIKLDVYQEVSSVDSNTLTNSSGPTTTKRSIQTSVLVDDGETVVLGGLMQDKVTGGDTKVPGLGDIPGLGALFRSRARSREKTDLMVFLRPVIVRDEADALRLSRTDSDHMRELQDASQLPHSAGMPDTPAPHLPPMPGTAPAAGPTNRPQAPSPAQPPAPATPSPAAPSGSPSAPAGSAPRER